MDSAAYCGSVVHGGAFSANSATLERLADGRLVLTALGERLVFRDEDASRVDLYWPPYPCNPKPERDVTLALWRDDPIVADCLNRAIPDKFPPGSLQSLTLRVHFAYENGELYPGSARRIDRSISGFPPLYPGALKPSELPDPPRLFSFTFVGVGRINAAFKVEIPTEGPADDLGYQMHRIGKAPPFYRLPADRRIGHAFRPLDVPCSDVSPSHCSVSVRSTDGFVGLGLEWLGPSPRADWKLYDAAARKIADSIFIDRAGGDIQ